MSDSLGDSLYTEPDPTPWLGRRMTPEEFLKLPEFKPYLELDEGIVIQKAYADPTHGLLQLALANTIEQHAARRRLGMAFIELTTCFADSVFIPDVAYVRFERLPIDRERRRFRDEVMGTPDIAAEIMCVGQPRDDVARRCRWYVENGVLVSLLVDPNDETVRVFRRGQAPVVLRDSDCINLDDALSEFDLRVESLLLRARPDWWGARPHTNRPSQV